MHFDRDHVRDLLDQGIVEASAVRQPGSSDGGGVHSCPVGGNA